MLNIIFLDFYNLFSCDVNIRCSLETQLSFLMLPFLLDLYWKLRSWEISTFSCDLNINCFSHYLDRNLFSWHLGLIFSMISTQEVIGITLKKWIAGSQEDTQNWILIHTEVFLLSYSQFLMRNVSWETERDGRGCLLCLFMTSVNV